MKTLMIYMFGMILLLELRLYSKIIKKFMCHPEINVVEKKISAENFKPAENSFAIPVSDPVSDKDFGSCLYIFISHVLNGAIDNTRGHIPMAVFVTSPFETEMFHIGEQLSSDKEKLVCRYYFSWLQSSSSCC